MICPHCGKENPDNSMFCSQCSEWILASVYVEPAKPAPVPEESAPQPEATDAAPPPKKQKKWLLPSILAAVALIVVCAICAALLLRGNSRFIEYKHDIRTLYAGSKRYLVYDGTVLDIENLDYYSAPQTSLDGCVGITYDYRCGYLYLIRNGAAQRIAQDVTYAVISAGGDGVAYVQANGDTRQLYLYNVPSEKAALIDTFTGVSVSALDLSPDGKKVVYQLHYSLSGKETMKYFDGKKTAECFVTSNSEVLIGISNDHLLYYSKNGRLMSYNCRTGDINELFDESVSSYRFNIDHSELLFHSGGSTYLCSDGGNIRLLAEVSLMPVLPENTVAHTNYNATTIPLYHFCDQAYVSYNYNSVTPSFSSSIFFAFNVHYLSKDGETCEKLISGVQSYALSENGKLLYYTDQEGGLYICQIRSGSTQKLAENVSNYTITGNCRYVYYTTTDGTLYRCDGKDGSGAEKIAQSVHISGVSGDGYLYYRDDTTLYAYRNGKSKKVLGNYNSIYSSENGFLYFVKGNAVYIPTSSGDVEKII